MFKTEIHIDLSNKYHQNRHTLVGYVDRYQPINKHGLIVNRTIKNEIEKRFDIKSVCHDLHACIIFLLLKDKIKYADSVVICDDYNFKKVYPALEILYGRRNKYLQKFKSLNQYRLEIGNPNFKSCADKFVKKANKHIKRINNIHKRNTIFDYFDYVKIKEIYALLKFILQEELRVEETQIYDELQQNLNR